MQLRVPHCGYRFRWSSRWGHEPCEGCAKMNGGPRMRSVPLGPSVELPVGHRTCEMCAKMGGGPHMRPVPLGPS
eukprot:5727976-Pyramimonas_sp.AAC.1